MAEQLVQPTESNASGTTTVTVDQTDSRHQGPVCILKLRKPRTDQKVQWTTDTVDNEEMDKKKSKCCCIYHKPRIFGESSSESSTDSDEMCSGHAEKKKKKKKKPACDFHDHGGKALGKSDDGETEKKPAVDVQPTRPEPEEPDAP